YNATHQSMISVKKEKERRDSKATILPFFVDKEDDGKIEGDENDEFGIEDEEEAIIDF
ncbi:21468_t:CDS:1, partial [Entrophospora sp. SA101]